MRAWTGDMALAVIDGTSMTGLLAGGTPHTLCCDGRYRDSVPSGE